MRAQARALAAILWVAITSVTALLLLPDAVAGLPEAWGADLGMSASIRFGVSAAMILAGVLGVVLFRPGLRLGGGRIALLALPVALVLILVLLAIALAAGVAIRNPVAAVPASLMGIGLAAILAQVIGEELLLRGLLQPILVDAWGKGPGVLASAGLFTLIHVAGGWDDPVSLLNITLAGIWFGLLALRTGGLLAPILAHFGYNWGEEALIGAYPNPGVGDFGAVFDFDLAGPAILGGSVDGFNASLVLSVLLALAVLPLAWPRRGEGAGE
ncbi:CPBP family intramembrane glutamic endopeptidase [Sphingomonas fennica]|uniref:CPBP family intramembrane glutamic endopeptidase n=1 Tax=Edaphosphingomonas fennica TaxID=114404 RepID=UPI001FE3ABA9|nr:CPBP family intramembrane glutamic endopeptidase [Sphingomonas fennica]